MIRTDEGLDFWARQCIALSAVAALALGWATTVAAYDSPTATGQRLCYKMDRYPLGHVLEGEALVLDAAGQPEFLNNLVDDGTGTGTLVPEPNLAFDASTGRIQDNPTPCKGTGQDGEKFYGLKLRYTDRGDGRIYDNNTGLTWEKKSDDGGLHDKDTTYTWEEALAYVKQLNNVCQNDETIDCSVNGDADCAAVGGLCGFAGKRDWRLPNVKELGTIVNFGIFSDNSVPTPTVDPVFNTNCVPGVSVLEGSCTHADDVSNDANNDPMPYGSHLTLGADGITPIALRVPMTYWSSTSGDAPGDAWFADYFTGDSGAHFKDADFDVDPAAKNPADPPSPANTEVIFAGHVRAVRGGESGLYQD